MTEAKTIRAVLFQLHEDMRDRSELVQTERWQGLDVENNPAAATHELRWQHLHMVLPTMTLDFYRDVLKPDLPWADEHFLERVNGAPYNPPPSEVRWPHSQGVNDQFKEGGLFNHTYPERFWPKYARTPITSWYRDDDSLRVKAYDTHVDRQRPSPPRRGIQYEYGDLEDLVLQMHKEPLNRQGILPMFFPEDTGIANPGRKPCTLHYHFMVRNRRMDVEYSIRSCDYHRHFRNDVYFAVRLLIWMIERLREMDQKSWQDVWPGQLIMNIGSLHLFRNDYIQRYGK